MENAIVTDMNSEVAINLGNASINLEIFAITLTLALEQRCIIEVLGNPVPGGKSKSPFGIQELP